MNNSNNNNKRTATLKAIMRMTFMTLLLMPLGGWKNNDNGEGNVQQHAVTAQTMCKYHSHIHRPPRHIHGSSRSRNHNNGQASSNTSPSIKQRINTWCKETKRKLTLNQAMKNYTNDNSTVVTIERQAKFNRQLKQQQGINKGDKTFPTKEDIKRGFYIHSPNTTAWKPKPMTAWNINNTSTAWTATTNTWLKLLVINALCNNNTQAMQHYMHDGTTMTWDTDTTNTKTRKQQQRKGTTTMEEEMAYITSIIVALFIITIAAINLQANKQLKERKKRTINRKEKEQ